MDQDPKRRRGGGRDSADDLHHNSIAHRRPELAPVLRGPAVIATLGVILATAAAAVAGEQKDAADFPNHPISVIVSVPPGGGVDTVTE